MLNSNYRPLTYVELPAFRGRQHYMHSFDLANPVMHPTLQEYRNVVVALCQAAGAAEGTAHMTVDEKVVEAGMSQRRPKPHVDGCFMPQAARWGHGGGGNWLHGCNHISRGVFARMPIIVAASVPGCRAWRGAFNGEPAADGDLSHIMDQLGDGEVLPANVGYLLSPDCVHESMTFEHAVQRIFLRIALPTSFAF